MSCPMLFLPVECSIKLRFVSAGRLFEYPEAGDEDKSYTSIAPSTYMKMRGNNPRGCMLTVPDPTVCVWSDPTKQDSSADYSDQIFVEYDGIMEHANVQVNIFSKEGILYSAVPPASQSPCRYWRVCKIQGDNIFSTNERVVDDPASGDIFSIRALLAKVHQHEDGEEVTMFFLQSHFETVAQSYSLTKFQLTNVP